MVNVREFLRIFVKDNTTPNVSDDFTPIVPNFVNDNFIEINNLISVTIERSLDDLVSIMNVQIPSTLEGKNLIRKNSYIDYRIIINGTLLYVFRGYIDSVNEKKSKTNTVLMITCLDKISALDRYLLVRPVKINQLREAINEMFGVISSDLGDWFQSELRLSGEDLIFNDVLQTTNYLDTMREIRKKTVLYLFYDHVNDNLVIENPSYLADIARNDVSTSVYDFDTSTNILNTLDYGNISSTYTRVEIIGAGGIIGSATDFLQEQLTGRRKTLTRYNRSTAGKESLNQQARDILLNEQQDNRITFDIPLNERTIFISIGDLCRINDNDRFTGNEIFIIETTKVTISKSEFIISLTCKSAVLSEFPSQFITGDFNITREETLRTVTNKEQPTSLFDELNNLFTES